MLKDSPPDDDHAFRARVVLGRGPPRAPHGAGRRNSPGKRRNSEASSSRLCRAQRCALAWGGKKKRSHCAHRHELDTVIASAGKRARNEQLRAAAVR
eukprot:3807865-Pyramimonas_sp.AAC.1